MDAVAEEQDDDVQMEPVASSSRSKSTSSSAATSKAKAAKDKKRAAELDAELSELGPATSAPKGRYGDRAPGSFVFCAQCGAKFTFTRYTRTQPNGDVLCPPCQKEQDDAKGDKDGPPAAKKARGRAVKPKPAPLEKPRPVVKSLQTCCIEVSHTLLVLSKVWLLAKVLADAADRQEH